MMAAKIQIGCNAIKKYLNYSWLRAEYVVVGGTQAQWIRKLGTKGHRFTL